MLKVYVTKENALVKGSYKRAALKSAKAAVKTEGRTGSLRVSLLFTDGNKIRELNKQYREKDEETDVLSFPSEEDKFLGDIALSLPMAQQQAAEYGHTTEREIAFLVAHSMLHLFGYDHMNEKDEEKMREKQREIMKKTGYKRDDC
jgi:probable rRNA maturation factor